MSTECYIQLISGVMRQFRANEDDDFIMMRSWLFDENLGSIDHSKEIDMECMEYQQNMKTYSKILNPPSSHPKRRISGSNK